MSDAERGGYIFFRLAESPNDPTGQVHMPVLLLKRLNDSLDPFRRAFFPNQFLFYPSKLKPWRLFATVTFIVYTGVVIFYSQSFTVVILNYLPAMIALLVA